MTWWLDTVGYEVYLRSFADGDGDGVGDLAGLRGRLDHLVQLGVDVVWITPFYPSPMHDHGYDVADYRDVAPVFGDLAALDACVSAIHDLGMRVLIDLVPNHTSSEHPWFQRARSARDDEYRDYYVWRDPGRNGGPPNNWVSVFGGPAWTLDETTGQYWLHLFLADQPDLNWDNPAVRDEFDAILRFWLARGVDGFRIDVAHALVKHPDLPDNPPAPEADVAAAIGTTAKGWETLEHRYDNNQEGVLDVYRRWRRITADHDAVLLGEVYVLDAPTLRSYLQGDGLDLAFWFKPLHLRWNPEALVRAFRDGLSLPPGRVAWVQGSHDRHRAAGRYGAGEAGRRRQLLIATLQIGLPGIYFVYQGEELGLEDGRISLDEAQDPVALFERDVSRGRDGCRTPLPWEPGPGMGFTTAAEPWLPFGGRSDADTVAAQRADPTSMLHRYGELLALRSELFSVLQDVEELPSPSAGALAYRRGGAVVAANLEAAAVSITPPAGQWRVRWSTTTVDVHAAGELRLPPESAAILTR